jgi:hypothetical protein
MQCYEIARKASLIDAALCCRAYGVSYNAARRLLCTRRLLMTQHFVVAELCRRKAERLTHLIMYTCLYNIM